MVTNSSLARRALEIARPGEPRLSARPGDARAGPGSSRRGRGARVTDVGRGRGGRVAGPHPAAPLPNVVEPLSLIILRSAFYS